MEVYLWARLSGRRINPAISVSACANFDLPPALWAEYPEARQREKDKAAADAARRQRRMSSVPRPPAGTPAGSPTRKRKRESLLPAAPGAFDAELDTRRPVAEHAKAVREALAYLADVTEQVEVFHRTTLAAGVYGRTPLLAEDEQLGDRLRDFAGEVDRASQSFGRSFARKPGGIRGRGGRVSARAGARRRSPVPEPILVDDTEEEVVRASGDEDGESVGDRESGDEEEGGEDDRSEEEEEEEEEEEDEEEEEEEWSEDEGSLSLRTGRRD